MAEISEKLTNSWSTAEEEEEGEEEYVVEKIINHRYTKKGKLEYYLKWKGFSDVDNTWEPAENLNCPELVEVYESEKLKKEKEKKAGKSSKTPKPSVVTDEERKTKKRKLSEEKGLKEKKKADKQNGFDKGLTAEEIIGATENNSEVHFLIKWKEAMHDYELIPSRIVNVKIPQMVIAFYEARLTWSTASNANDQEESEDSVKKKKEEEEENDETPTLNGGEEHAQKAIAAS